MSEADKRKSAINNITEDLLLSKFTQDVGSKARVERTEIHNEHMDQLRDVVCEVGRNLEQVGAVPKGMMYLGSMSVHIYKSEILRTAAFATVSSTEKIPFDLADAALRELTGKTHESYGRARKKLRSGF